MELITPRRKMLWSATKQDLLSLIGHLNHTATVVKQGAHFYPQPHWCLRFSQTPWPPHPLVSSSLCGYLLVVNLHSLLEWNIFATSTTSVPAHLHRRIRFLGLWSALQTKMDSGPLALWMVRGENCALKMIPILLTVACWGPSWRGECILRHSDNAAVVYAINKGSAHEYHLMYILCSLIFFSAANNVSITASHIPGALNSSADALFCNNISFLFFQPTGNPIPCSTVPGSAQSGAHQVPALDIIGLDQAVRRYFDQSIT